MVNFTKPSPLPILQLSAADKKAPLSLAEKMAILCHRC
jgi:hypothetical protein